MSHDESEPLFHTALSAIRWALSDRNADLTRNSLWRYINSVPEPASRGLGGFDGAGQAGIIVSHVMRLGTPKAQIVIAQAAVAKLPCACGRDCCSGQRSNPIWVGSVESVAKWYLTTREPDCKRPRLVVGCLRRFFGEHVGLEVLAKRNGVSRSLVAQQNGEILAPVKSYRDSAWREVEDSLTKAGLVHDAMMSAA